MIPTRDVNIVQYRLMYVRNFGYGIFLIVDAYYMTETPRQKTMILKPRESHLVEL